MQLTFEILKSKIGWPGVEATIRRERLGHLVREMLHHRMTVITAGAGYGKSTLAAQAGHFLNVDTVWYRLEKSDNDLITFIHYAIAGFRKLCPEFGNNTIERLHQSPASEDRTLSVLSSFINEIELYVHRETLLVLDDFHAINTTKETGKEINEALLFLLDHMPGNIHIVITSRTVPLLPLSRYRARLEILDIVQSDLEFTKNEISELYSQLFGFSIPETSMNPLHKKTEGWVSGLILFYHYSRGSKSADPESLMSKIKGTNKIFADYMGENVYMQLADDVKDFLLKTSFLPRVDTDFSDALLGIDNSLPILAELETNHLFTTSVDDGRRCFSYHHLFQDFLQKKFIGIYGREEVRALHARAAIIHEKKNNFESAMIHYIHAEKFNSAIKILAKTGRQISLEGRYKRLDDIIKLFPEELQENDPWLLSLRGYILATSGNLQGAVSAGRLAYTRFCEADKAGEAIYILNDTGRVYYLIGDFVKAEELFQELIKQKLPIALHVETLGHLIFTSAYLKRPLDSDAYFKEASGLMNGVEGIENKEISNIKAWIHINYGFRYYFTGDFNEALKHAEKANHYLQQSGFSTIVTFYYHLTSMVYFFKGDFAKAMEMACKGLDLIRSKRFQDTQKAWLLIATSSICFFEGKLEKASQDVLDAQSIFQKGGSKWGEVNSCIVLSILYSLSGKKNESAKKVLDGLIIANEYNLPVEEGKLTAFLAMAMIEENSFEQAEMFLEKAGNLLDASKFETCFITFLRAYLDYRKNNPKGCIEKGKAALTVCMENDYGQWFCNAQPWIFPVLVSVYNEGSFQEYILQMFGKRINNPCEGLKNLGKSAEPSLQKACTSILNFFSSASPDALRVYCLGRFRVFVGSREIVAGHWKSRKALEIFKYLILSRNRGFTHKEVLMELLWPEESSEKTGKRLHVALPALRKTLEPDLKRGSTYLVREKDSYRLEKGEGGFIDIDCFNDEITAAEKETEEDKSLEKYLAAEKLYGGDLFSEDLYCEWCFHEREKFRKSYLLVLRKIIGLYKEKKEYENCIQFSEKYLEHELFDEKMYASLMSFYAATGNPSMVIRTYEKCRKHIEDELSCPLESATINLFNKLV